MNAETAAGFASPDPSTVTADHGQLRNDRFAIKHALPVLLGCGGVGEFLADFQADALDRVGRDLQSVDSIHQQRCTFERPGFAVDEDELAFEARRGLPTTEAHWDPLRENKTIDMDGSGQPVRSRPGIVLCSLDNERGRAWRERLRESALLGWPG